MGKVVGLLRLCRWPGAVTAAANAATGFLLAHGPTSQGGILAASGAIAGGMIVYLGGVALNDVVDAERDRTLHPHRPIPAGEVAIGDARAFGLALLVVGSLVACLLAGFPAGAATTAAALFAVTYDLGAKKRRVAGSLSLGLARGANGLAGAIAAAGTLPLLTALGPALATVYPLALVAYTALVTFASTFEDREVSPLEAGALSLAIFVAAALPWSLFYATWRGYAAFALVPLAATLVVGARDATVPGGAGMGALVRHAIFGFLLVDSAWLFGVGRYEAGFWMILVYVAVRLLLLRSRS